MFKIAIFGRANAGKNTLAKMLVKQIRTTTDTLSAGYLAFADPIKSMGLMMFPQLPRKYFFGPSKYRNEIIPGAKDSDGNPLTVRQLLLDLGTKMGRGYKDSVWLDNFDTRFKKASYKDIIVVPDGRFANELAHLKRSGFYQIRLYRDTGSPGINHISETGQNTIQDSEFDSVLFNNGSLNKLKEEVKRIIPKLQP